MRFTLFVVGILTGFVALVVLLGVCPLVRVDPAVPLCTVNGDALLLLYGAIHQSKHYKRWGNLFVRTPRSDRAWYQLGQLLWYEGMLLVVLGCMLFWPLIYFYRIGFGLAMLSISPGVEFIFVGRLIVFKHMRYEGR